MKLKLRDLVVIVLAFLLLVCITLYGYVDADQKSRTVKVPPANRGTFSDVYILLDGTGTMSKSAFDDARRIVKDRIIAPLGVNDLASCYVLAARFDDGHSVVFGKASEEQPPKLNESDAQEILSLYKAVDGPGRLRLCREEGCPSLRNLQSEELKAEVDAVRKQWFCKVDGLERIDGSDYVGALEGIKRLLGGPGAAGPSKQNKVRETWLFIVGDLINESKKARQNHTDNAAFGNVDHIVLISPFNSDRDWESIEKFWGNYFGDIKTERRTFAQALRDEYLIKPNPTSDLELPQPPTFSDNFRPYRTADLIVLLITALYFLTSFVSQKLSARRPTPQRTPNVRAGSGHT